MKKQTTFLIVFLLCSTALLADNNIEKVTYSYGTSALFVGIMAALWASRTGRSALLWFFFGWILAPIACLFALLRNLEDKRKK
ncbi:MAG: hypothetical protein ACE5LC_05760 [Candidatus Aminicenantales bacterium]